MVERRGIENKRKEGDKDGWMDGGDTKTRGQEGGRGRENEE